MRRFNSLILTAAIVAAPVLFTGCSDNVDEVGRDRNVPNNIEDNYTRDNDATTNNRTNRVDSSENEEQAGTIHNNTATGGTHLSTDNNMSTNSDLLKRIEKLEKEVDRMRKNEKVGQK